MFFLLTSSHRKKRTATFEGDTAILTSDLSHNRTPQQHINVLETWSNQWRIKVNNSVSSQIYAQTQWSVVKHLGQHLDQKVTWKAHTIATQLSLTFKKSSWLIGKHSQLFVESEMFKTILKYIWRYGIELWGCSKPSNTEILQVFQSKMLGLIAVLKRNDFVKEMVSETTRKSPLWNLIFHSQLRADN